ncbi:FAD-dependent oxidoreductase [Bradyrhizobium sp. LHD-71]|uniref:NAD(P)/FAD-dependent oxidoreductase n=1 Tax=Bradyrhizobium sp. LHD-71 TaxID=3072141 RepID=UPI00280D437C|nr:FAD-dependent oxidoreductase [Bradyrhizobium sp. LHD-71]MDQ8730692.1 FAD-dependent oxidoreductase [Bradyrhizobium sp. LHD-71]
MHVVICGGGVVGACIAYFLARRGVGVTVVERTGVACAASGKAGGFLARDWCAGSPLDALARRSFALHASLREDLGGDWGYQRMTAYSGLIVGEGDRRRHAAAGLNWLSDGIVIAGQLSTTDTTAIVHPGSFTLAMMHAAEQHGARVHHGQVTGIARSDNGNVEGVVVDGETIRADAIVIAMGPWSLQAAQWLRIPPVFGQQSPSLVYDTGKDVPAEALFLDTEDDGGNTVTVEVFPRADGTTHVCAFSGESPLPLDPAAVAPDHGTMAKLQALCERLSPAFRADRIVARQACFRPVTQDGLPLIGKIPGSDGAYIATGHNVWGILNAPATGEAVAELVVEGEAAATDLAPFDPARLRPIDPARVRIG